MTCYNYRTLLYPRIRLVVDWYEKVNSGGWAQEKLIDSSDSINNGISDLIKTKLLETYFGYEDILLNMPKKYEDLLTKEQLFVIRKFPSLIEDYFDGEFVRLDAFIGEIEKLDIDFLAKLDLNDLGSKDRKKIDMCTNIDEMIDVCEYLKDKLSHVDLSENALEALIIKNLDIVEEGLTFIDNQVRVDGGIIDILARDKKGMLTIIELKVVDNCKDLIFQAAYYPTQFEEEVRMITIAPGYITKIEKALTNTFNKKVEMKTYTYKKNKLTIKDNIVESMVA